MNLSTNLLDMARLINASAVQAIMKQRVAISESHVGGKKLLFSIAGNGTKLQMTNKDGVAVCDDQGVVLDKKIFNLSANSEIAMKNPVNRELLKFGLIAERAGEAQAAHEFFNQYLNKVQVSFNIVLPSKLEDKLYDGVEISARVEKITTENGSLLTIDPKTISIVEPELASKTTFSMDDLMAEIAEVQPETPKAGELAA